MRNALTNIIGIVILAISSIPCVVIGTATAIVFIFNLIFKKKEEVKPWIFKQI